MCIIYMSKKVYKVYLTFLFLKALHFCYYIFIIDVKILSKYIYIYILHNFEISYVNSIMLFIMYAMIKLLNHIILKINII